MFSLLDGFVPPMIGRMRRVRDRTHPDKYIYEVLITPYGMHDPDMSLVIGNWIDPTFKAARDEIGYWRVIRFASEELAQRELARHPPFDFDYLVRLHKDIFVALREIITRTINDFNVRAHLVPVLRSARQLQTMFFDRVLIHGREFTTANKMTDIIQFIVISPYLKDLRRLAYVLPYDKRLRIGASLIIHNGTMVKFVGETDIGTSYEILFAHRK